MFALVSSSIVATPSAMFVLIDFLLCPALSVGFARAKLIGIELTTTRHKIARSKTTHDRGCPRLRAVLLLPQIDSFIVIPLCSETAFSSRFYFLLLALELCNVKMLSQFVSMRDG